MQTDNNVAKKMNMIDKVETGSWAVSSLSNSKPLNSFYFSRYSQLKIDKQGKAHILNTIDCTFKKLLIL